MAVEEFVTAEIPEPPRWSLVADPSPFLWEGIVKTPRSSLVLSLFLALEVATGEERTRGEVQVVPEGGPESMKELIAREALGLQDRGTTGGILTEEIGLLAVAGKVATELTEATARAVWALLYLVEP